MGPVGDAFPFPGDRSCRRFHLHRRTAAVHPPALVLPHERTDCFQTARGLGNTHHRQHTHRQWSEMPATSLRPLPRRTGRMSRSRVGQPRPVRTCPDCFSGRGTGEHPGDPIDGRGRFHRRVRLAGPNKIAPMDRLGNPAGRDDPFRGRRWVHGLDPSHHRPTHRLKIKRRPRRPKPSHPPRNQVFLTPKIR